MSVRCKLAELQVRKAILIDLLDRMVDGVARDPKPQSLSPARCVIQGRMEELEIVEAMIKTANDAYQQLLDMYSDNLGEKKAA